MRLLLDEMLPAGVAEQLRTRGHDAAALIERPELRGLPDAEVFRHAQAGRQVVVTYDRDFLLLDREYRAAGRDHHGIVILHPRRFPQGSVGPLVSSLEAFLADPVPYASFVHWLA